MIQKLLISFAFIAVLLTSAGYYTHFNKKVQNYPVTIHKDSSLKELNVAFISDTHLGSGTDMTDLLTLAATLNQKQYDLVCLGGDLFDETTPQEMVENALKIISQIKTTYGIYAVNGNHEHYAQILNESLYTKNNIHHLSNNYVCIDNLFNIIGKEDIVAKTKMPIDKICQGINTTLPTIILDHNPKRYQEIMNYGDLQLSGHTHAGQFFPMTLATALLYDNVYGILEKNDFSLIVTSGYGSWGFPIRFLTQCEYVDIKITFTKK